MKHCIIGAGFCGLPIAKKLKELGEDFDVLDQNPGIGGLWHTGVYRDAHIISSKRTTEFPDFPMPAQYPDFPSKAQMQRYFEAYAQHFGLTPHIQLNSKVVSVRPAPDHAQTHQWLVTLASGEQRRYQTVSIANGHNWSPRPVTHPGHFDGKVMRSNEYWEPSIFQNQRVLVVGYGNTGCDIAVDAGRVGASSDISMRSGNYFFPKMFAGVPLADLLYFAPVSWAWLDRLIARFVIWCVVGSLSRYGVQKPKHRPLDKHPIVNTDLVQAIRHGRVKVRPDIARLDGKRVYFTDGSSGEYDLIVYATGYTCNFPMLDAKDGILDWDGELPVLFMQNMAPKFRGLFFPGIGQARTGGGPLYQGMGYLTARMVAYEGRSEEGVMAALRRQPVIQWLCKPWVERLRGEKIQQPVSFRSLGIGEARRRIAFVKGLLDKIGAPDAPSARSPAPLQFAVQQ